MRYIIFFPLYLLLILQLNAQDLDSDTEEVINPKIVEESVRSQVQGNNSFAADLYFRLRSSHGNIVFSPYSISSALAIPYIGSIGATRAQMQSVLHYLSNDIYLYSSVGWLNQHLSSSGKIGPNETKLFTANSLWVQRDYRLTPFFLTTVNKYFKSLIHQTDFMRNPDGARLNINKWVQEQTQGRIVDLIQKQDITPSTRLVVISSIFMKAVWERPFNPSLTHQASFFNSKSTTTTVHMMTNTGFYPHYEESKFSMIEIPYKSGWQQDLKLSLLIFLPTDPNALEDIEGKILTKPVDIWLQNLKSENVILSIPRMTVSKSIQLNEILIAMGMAIPFSGGADFSGIDGAHDLSINKVLHKAYISIDEKGTEAVAATAVPIGLTAFPSEGRGVVFRADHPFLYMIVDRSTNSILFLGRFIGSE